MKRIELILPTSQHKDQVLAYKSEFELNDESMRFWSEYNNRVNN